MPLSNGFNHVATITSDLDRIVAFYRDVLDAPVIFEMAETDDHPRMSIIDFGGGTALNVFEQTAETILGDRTKAGGRGPVDHFGIGVASLADLNVVLGRLVAAGADVGEIHTLGDTWSLFFRDPDGMELEMCTPVNPADLPDSAP